MSFDKSIFYQQGDVKRSVELFLWAEDTPSAVKTSRDLLIFHLNFSNSVKMLLVCCGLLSRSEAVFQNNRAITMLVIPDWLRQFCLMIRKRALTRKSIS